MITTKGRERCFEYFRFNRINVCLIAICLIFTTGCTPPTLYRAYRGPIRPPSEIAVLNCREDTRIVAIDDIRVPSAATNGIVEVSAPAVHSITIVSSYSSALGIGGALYEKAVREDCERRLKRPLRGLAQETVIDFDAKPGYGYEIDRRPCGPYWEPRVVDTGHLEYGGFQASEKPVGATMSGQYIDSAELPASFRMTNVAPSDAHQVEICESELRIDEKITLPLKAGRIGDDESDSSIASKIINVFRSPTRSRLALRVCVSTPYDTVVKVLDLAYKTGIRNVAFKVQKAGNGNINGWLEINNFKVISPAEKEVVFEKIQSRPWSDFTQIWDRVYNDCKSAKGVSCTERPNKIAEGGHVQTSLFSSVKGATIRFKQVGVSLSEEIGDIGAKKKGEGETKRNDKISEDSPSEVVDAEFQFGRDDASYRFSRRSPISAAMAHLCGKSACGVLFSASPDTAALLFVAFIGAAFPDGTSEPQIYFVK